MNTKVNEVPETIATYLKDMTVSFGLPNDEETMSRLNESWLEKQEAFDDKTIEFGMEEAGSLERDDERAALALTFSGSLVSLGPLKEDGRSIEYSSIGLRHDVPESLRIENANLQDDAETGKCMEFENSALKATSPIFKIAVCPDSLSIDEQETLVKEAATVIVDTFVDMNKDLYEKE